jgi:hypothetical protein
MLSLQDNTCLAVAKVHSAQAAALATGSSPTPQATQPGLPATAHGNGNGSGNSLLQQQQRPAGPSTRPALAAALGAAHGAVSPRGRVRGEV